VQGIRTLASELATLRQTTSQEMQRSVFANYGAFIRCALHATRALAFARFRHLAAHARRTRSTAKEIADLQSDLSRSRALLSGMGSVLATLREPPADDFFDAALLSVATPSKRRRDAPAAGGRSHASRADALRRPAACSPSTCSRPRPHPQPRRRRLPSSRSSWKCTSVRPLLCTCALLIRALFPRLPRS
jgi:hypothetical protein